MGTPLLAALFAALSLWSAVAPVGLTRASRSSTSGGRAKDPVRGRRPPGRAARRAEAVRAREDLPHVVGLVAVGVEAGAPVPVAVRRACDAFGGELCLRLRVAAVAVEHGADPVATWSGAARDEALAPLARALSRSARTGASVVRTLALLADDLADESRAAQEDAARRVGVKAALPLGLCLLPAFLLLGIVPLVAGLASQLTFG